MIYFIFSYLIDCDTVRFFMLWLQRDSCKNKMWILLEVLIHIATAISYGLEASSRASGLALCLSTIRSCAPLHKIGHTVTWYTSCHHCRICSGKAHTHAHARTRYICTRCLSKQRTRARTQQRGIPIADFVQVLLHWSHLTYAYPSAKFS